MEKILDMKKEKVLLGLLQESLEATICHPFNYARILIQIGYEPFPPQEEKIFGKTFLALPNMLSYVDYIASVDGVLGCFRGLFPAICCNAVYFLVTKIMMQIYCDQNYRRLSKKNILRLPRRYNPRDVARDFLAIQDEDEVEIDIMPAIKHVSSEFICITYGVFASHPLYVIMIRTMAEFVGRENKHSSIRASIGEIYRRNGITGFFKGVTARLLAEYIIAVAPVVAVIVASKIKKRRSWFTERFVAKIAFLLAEKFTNQFFVVANIRAVNNSGLVVGLSPYTDYYWTSVQCWFALSNLNQLNRGIFRFWRIYQGPTEEVDGKLIPSININGIHFGPIHQVKH